LLSYWTDLVLYHQAFKDLLPQKGVVKHFLKFLILVYSLLLMLPSQNPEVSTTSYKPASITLLYFASIDLSLPFWIVLKMTLLFYLTTMHISTSWCTESLTIWKYLWSTAWQIVTEWATWIKRCLFLI